MTTTSQDSPDDLLGVSVHWLKTGVMEEIQSTPGLSRESTIYQLEDLQNQNRSSLVRQKGAQTTCPIDGKLGSSYVHALERDPDKVGPASYMLSYAGGYSYGDIVDTLVSYCDLNKLDKKRTYVWLCFLCVNQHRVVQSRDKGQEVSSDSFLNTFQSRILDIGRVLVMLTPWEDPYYFKRMWCLFELYQAHAHGDQVQVTIVMPPKQMEVLEKELLNLKADEHSDGKNVSSIFDAVAKMRLQKAKATFEDDRVNIMESCKEQPGYHKIHRTLHELFREWIENVLVGVLVAKYGAQAREDPSPGRLVQHATVCIRVGDILQREEHNLPRALGLFRTAIATLMPIKAIRSDHRALLGRAQSGVGLVLLGQGIHEDALQSLHEALNTTTEYHQSNESDKHNGELLGNYQNKDAEIALCHANIGSCLCAMGQLDGALLEYRTALELYNDDQDERTATLFSGLAEVLNSQGDTEGARREYFNALRVLRGTLGESHQVTATCISNFGLCSAGPTVVMQLRRALNIRLSVLGRGNAETAASYANLGMFYQDSGNPKLAIENYEEALDIYRDVFYGEENAIVAKVLTDLGNAKKSECKFEDAMEVHQKALKAQLEVYQKENHPHVGLTYSNIGSVYEVQDDLETAREMYQKALNIIRAAVEIDSMAAAKALGGQDEVDYVTNKVIERLQRVEKYLRNGGKPVDIKKVELKRQVLKKRLSPEQAQHIFEDLQDSGALGPPLQLQT